MNGILVARILCLGSKPDCLGKVKDLLIGVGDCPTTVLSNSIVDKMNIFANGCLQTLQSFTF